MEHKHSILARINPVETQNITPSPYETFRKLIRCKVEIANQNHSIYELNDCNHKIINLVDKHEINPQECVHLINDVYQYAPLLKPDNGNRLRACLKQSGYRLALKTLNRIPGISPDHWFNRLKSRLTDIF